MSLILYELEGRHGERYSQFSWRSRLALAHMGLQAESRPVRVSDKAAIAFSAQNNVPILVAGDTVVSDSWRIAEYLAAEHASKPSIFGGETGHALARFINAWVDRQIVPRLVPLLVIDLMDCLDPEDALHMRIQMEKAFRATLETLAANRATDIVAFRRLLDPARVTLRAQPFLSGGQPAYADYILFSVFQWARIVSRFDPLEADDTVAAWRERMLDLFDGLARAEPARSDRGA